MRSSWKTTAIALMTIAFPFGAMANISGTPTLTAGMSLNLDTGATSSSGGDLLWSGTTLTPQSKASAYDAGAILSASQFSSLTSTILSSLSALFNSSPIKPAVNDVIGAKTNGGNYAAILVTAISGTSITVQFITFTSSTAPSGPTVTGVLNNYSYTPPGFSNSGIAPSTLFVITGSGLADPTKSAVLQDSTVGLPTTLNGASVKVTSGSTTVTPVFYYAIATQLALVLPSNTPIGTAQLTVTYNNQTSAPYTFQVVKSAPGFATYYGSGSGLGSALNPATYVPYSYSNSIPPGTTVVLYGSGLGADPATDTTFVGSAYNINSLAHIYVGGVDAPIQYQGSFYYPGLNQINVTIPASAPTGCNVPLVGVTTSGTPTNFISLPIGNGPCSDPVFGTLGTQLQSLSGQTTVKTGIVGLYHSTSPTGSTGAPTVQDLAIASFSSYTGSTYGASASSVSLGGCIVSQLTVSGGSTGTSTGLDAGTITASSPNGVGPTTLMSIPTVKGSYFAQLPTGFITAAGGMFGFKGGGGADVGAFSTSVNLPTPLLTWTNQSAAATVTRSSGLPVTWSGGSTASTGQSYVTITGISISGSASGAFTCIAPVSAQQFTVPPYVLAALPAGTGNVVVGNETGYGTFSASGIDLGLAVGLVEYSVNSTFN